MAQFNEIIRGNTPVLVDFFATWCGPCKTMAPVLEQVKSQLGEQVRILKVDVDKNQALAQYFQIRTVPTLKLFINGQEKWSGSGVIPASQLTSIIRSAAEQATSA